MAATEPVEGRVVTAAAQRQPAPPSRCEIHHGSTYVRPAVTDPTFTPTPQRASDRFAHEVIGNLSIAHQDARQPANPCQLVHQRSNELGVRTRRREQPAVSTRDG